MSAANARQWLIPKVLPVGIGGFGCHVVALLDPIGKTILSSSESGLTRILADVHESLKSLDVPPGLIRPGEYVSMAVTNIAELLRKPKEFEHVLKDLPAQCRQNLSDLRAGGEQRPEQGCLAARLNRTKLAKEIRNGLHRLQQRSCTREFAVTADGGITIMLVSSIAGAVGRGAGWFVQAVAQDAAAQIGVPIRIVRIVTPALAFLEEVPEDEMAQRRLAANSFGWLVELEHMIGHGISFELAGGEKLVCSHGPDDLVFHVEPATDSRGRYVGGKREFTRQLAMLLAHFILDGTFDAWDGYDRNHRGAARVETESSCGLHNYGGAPVGAPLSTIGGAAIRYPRESLEQFVHAELCLQGLTQPTKSQQPAAELQQLAREYLEKVGAAPETVQRGLGIPKPPGREAQVCQSVDEALECFLYATRINEERARTHERRQAEQVEALLTAHETAARRDQEHWLAQGDTAVRQRVNMLQVVTEQVRQACGSLGSQIETARGRCKEGEESMTAAREGLRYAGQDQPLSKRLWGWLVHLVTGRSRELSELLAAALTVADRALGRRLELQALQGRLACLRRVGERLEQELRTASLHATNVENVLAGLRSDRDRAIAEMDSVVQAGTELLVGASRECREILLQKANVASFGAFLRGKLPPRGTWLSDPDLLKKLMDISREHLGRVGFSHGFSSFPEELKAQLGEAVARSRVWAGLNRLALGDGCGAWRESVLVSGGKQAERDVTPHLQELGANPQWLEVPNDDSVYMCRVISGVPVMALSSIGKLHEAYTRATGHFAHCIAEAQYWDDPLQGPTRQEAKRLVNAGLRHGFVVQEHAGWYAIPFLNGEARGKLPVRGLEQLLKLLGNDWGIQKRLFDKLVDHFLSLGNERAFQELEAAGPEGYPTRVIATVRSKYNGHGR